ncbi:hypothetical protein LF844_12505 [Metapseudomonas lalkuanensis]|uniref:hypothetical protein n=1 Tax=Metapseudomonas lalkuanensis TaxID=2604832 RepID=UPI001CF5DB1C|nr:hypothetical protein [Pseudomonas lalkuanensis]UCP00588.1 hypothetical protein LF844_12505 [Pseudomonas lalkuanensis]
MRAISIALTSLALYGCAADMTREEVSEPLQIPTESRSQLVVNFRGSGKATGDAEWARLKSAWRAALESEASTYGLAVSEQAGEIRMGTAPGLLMVIDVNDFRYITEAKHPAFEFWRDNAWVDAEVTYLDAQTAKRYGERTYDTSSPVWEDVLSAKTDVQIQAIAKDMVDEIRTVAPTQEFAPQPAVTFTPPATTAAALPQPGPASEGAKYDRVSGGDGGATEDGGGVTREQWKQRQLDQLKRDTDLSYQEYQRRYREITGQ